MVELLSWAAVTRIDRGDTTVRRYDIQYPYLDGAAHRVLERAALDALGAVASARLREPGIRTWLEVGSDGSWAIEADGDGLDLRDAWRLAARERPHDVELAWRHPGAMADTTYRVTTYDAARGPTTRTQLGPWDPTDPIRYPDPQRHRTVHVRRAPIAPRLAARVVVEAGRLAQRLHAAGIVHGMLTSEAIAVARDGTVELHRIATYLCRRRGAQYVGSGTPGRFFADLAPELVGGGAVTPASDVFQLASTLYELLAFSPAWMRATAHDSIEALRLETLPAISTIDPDAAALDAVLAHALARDPAARPSLRELVDTIEAAYAASASDRQDRAQIVADAMRADPARSSAHDVPM